MILQAPMLYLIKLSDSSYQLQVAMNLEAEQTVATPIDFQINNGQRRYELQIIGGGEPSEHVWQTVFDIEKKPDEDRIEIVTIVEGGTVKTGQVTYIEADQR